MNRLIVKTASFVLCLCMLISVVGCQTVVRPPVIPEETSGGGASSEAKSDSLTEITDEPGSSADVSSTSAETSESVSDETETVIEQTEPATSEPEITTEEPVITTEAPETTTKKAESTTKKPKKTTAQTTKAPETTKKEDPPPATELYVKDYGAKGDGVTDDGPAISRAVRDAVSSHLPLLFESGKTYRVETSTNSADPFRSPFSFNGVSNVTIDGRGARFIYNPDLAYYVVNNCTNVTIKNCTFDYIDSPYLVGKVKSVSGNTVTFTTDIEPFRDSFDYSNYTSFSIKYNTGIQGCPHKFIKRMDKVGTKEVTVTYKSNPGYSVGNTVFLPNPGIGHVKGESIYIGHSHGVLLFENIKICASGSFVFAVKSNDADITFRSVDFVPPETMTREINMVAWRDGYHCKDNRGAIHWENCYMDPHGGLFDDVFNVSCTLGTVTSVRDDGSVETLNLEYKNMGRNVSFDCKAGDVLDFYDINTGVFYGTAVVGSVSGGSGGSSRITLTDQNFSSFPTVGCVIGNRATCAPGSTIKNCIFSGSYRFLRDITIENSELYIRAIWIMVEGSVEGPIPGNVFFKNTQLHGGTLEIDAYNRNTKTYMPEIAEQIKGIRVENCEYFYFGFKCTTGKCSLEGYN